MLVNYFKHGCRNSMISVRNNLLIVKGKVTKTHLFFVYVTGYGHCAINAVLGYIVPMSQVLSIELIRNYYFANVAKRVCTHCF